MLISSRVILSRRSLTSVVLLRSSVLPPLRAIPTFRSSSSSAAVLLSQRRGLATVINSIPFSMVLPTSHYPVPPVPPPKWTLSPTDINSITSNSISKTKELVASIIALPKGSRTFDNVIRKLAWREGEESKECEPAIFLQYVHGDEEVREMSVKCDKELQEYGLQLVTDPLLYAALLDAQSHSKDPSNNIHLNKEEQRLMDRMILERVRNGLDLNEEGRKELIELKKKILGLQVDFQKACNEEKGFIEFTKEELEGVPEDIISGFPKSGDKYQMTFKTPDITPVKSFAILPETRKRATMGFEAKTIDNVPVLEEIVRLRKEVARVLGFENYAEWVLQVKMAKNSKNVFSFLSDLETKLRPIGLLERSQLLSLKSSFHTTHNLPLPPSEKDTLYLWDYKFYDRLWIEKNLKLDEEKVKEYFMVKKVVPAILEIYKRLLGVVFYEVPRREEEGGLTWHDDAVMYAVWDAGKDGKEGEFLGYMHLDLFPRENKYGHAAVWGLVPGWEKEDGTRNYPVVSMVANLAKETPSRPALMKHSDTVTFFHEMGHAFHGLLSRTQFARFHGTSVSRDFVEAPSQMLENWCWTSPQLKEMTSHYETGEPLPDEMIKSIIASKSALQGLFNLRQLFFGMYDMTLHTSKEENLDQTALWNDLREKISLVSSGDEKVGGQSGFAHIAGGYEAGYYGYLYSQSFSADMFASVFSEDPMDPSKGALYREKILRPGGSRDEMESLVDFLGREPTNTAFLLSLMGPDMGKAEAEVDGAKL